MLSTCALCCVLVTGRGKHPLPEDRSLSKKVRRDEDRLRGSERRKGRGERTSYWVGKGGKELVKRERGREVVREGKKGRVR
jgi:hypothetical protein